jgi:hypothetical protein
MLTMKVNSYSLETKTSSVASILSSSTPLDLKLSHVICPESNQLITPSNLTAAQQQAIDISILREKSRNLDLPLISALCNDRSLLKQTKAFVMTKHPRQLNQANSLKMSSKNKYPVSGSNVTQSPKTRKTIVSHRHPNDKLPPLPKQNEKNKNNYVMDPIQLKQKSNQNTNV